MSYLNEIDKWIENNNDFILESLSKLIQIKTENFPPTGNEKRGQEYLYNLISNYIPENDIDLFNIDEVKGIREHPLFFPMIDGLEKKYDDRPNLVAKFKGIGNGKSLIFSGHMDTMPASGEKWKVFEDPFSGKIKNGKMYGRGSADMKSGILAGVFALKCLHDLRIKLKGDVFFESVVDEEYGGSNGTVACRLRYPNIDFAILSEPTGLIVGIETVGGTDWKITVEEEGGGGIDFGSAIIPNPVYKLSKIALALEKYEKIMNKRAKVPKTYKTNKYLRIFTYQISSGGSTYLETQSIPTHGHIYFWLETFAYMKEEKIREDIINFMKEELFKYKDFKQKFPKFENVIRFMGGHKTDINHPAMASIKKAFKDQNIDYKYGGLGLACDAFVFKPVGGTDVVVLGPIGGNIHSNDEYVEIESFLGLIKTMVLTATDYCS